ncbi:MAG: hypothetical protein NVS9B15_06540 [Acidobacteriaceae bacterium]
MFLAAATLLLLIAGAFVTSNDAGLAVPDWPTSFGSFYKMPPMVAGIKYEHGHRMIAENIGLLTVVLSVLILLRAGLRKAAVQAIGMTALFVGAIIPVGLAHGTSTHGALLSPSRALAYSGIFGFGALVTAITMVLRGFAQSWPAEAKVAIIALPTVMVQGVLGGLTVLTFLPWYVSTLHATVGQTFFCLITLLALVSSQPWKTTRHFPTPGRKDRVIRIHAYATIASIYIQLMLGAAFRHNGISVKWHIFWAIAVTVLVAATGIRVLIEYGNVRGLRLPAIGMLAMLFVQLPLGLGAYLTRVVWNANAPQPMFSMVLTTVAHVAGGAVLLALSWILAAQVSHTLAGKAADILQFRPHAVSA